jgi:hypothetical protein
MAVQKEKADGRARIKVIKRNLKAAQNWDTIKEDKFVD